MPDSTASAIRDAFLSPNEPDENFEFANVVDGLFRIATSIHRLGRAIELLTMGDEARTIYGDPIIMPIELAPLNRIARALEKLTQTSEEDYEDDTTGNN